MWHLIINGLGFLFATYFKRHFTLLTCIIKSFTIAALYLLLIKVVIYIFSLIENSFQQLLLLRRVISLERILHI